MACVVAAQVLLLAVFIFSGKVNTGAAFKNDESRQYFRSAEKLFLLGVFLSEVKWDRQADMTFDELMSRLAETYPHVSEFRLGFDGLRRRLLPGREYGHILWISDSCDASRVPFVWDETGYPGGAFVPVVFLNGAYDLELGHDVTREAIRLLIEEIAKKAPAGTPVAEFGGKIIVAP